MFMPFHVLGVWLRALLSIVLIAAGFGLLAYWYTHREQVVTEYVPAAETEAPPANGEPPDRVHNPRTEPRVRVVYWRFGANWETASLLGGLALLLWSCGGGWLVSPHLWRPRDTNPPRPVRGTPQRLQRPDGSTLYVESFGPADGMPVILIHGWSLDSDEWCYTKAELGHEHRLIVWDLPGLGASDRPADRDWSLDKLADDLDAVVALAGGKPVVIVGHSIGGMILLTYCKRYPDRLGGEVRGLVLAQTTYTNPVRTTSMATLYTALQKPVLEPLCHLMVWLSPVVRVLNWMSYLNGSAHRSTDRESFSGHETRDQLDFITRYYVKAPPDVIARGMLAMFRYDATAILPRIGVPALVVAGDRDGTCKPEASEFLAHELPAAQLETLADAKHCGLFEHHARFNALLAQFLARCGGTAVATPPRQPMQAPTPAGEASRLAQG